MALMQKQSFQSPGDISTWIASRILISSKVDSVFKEQILNITCALALKLSEKETAAAAAVSVAKKELLPSLAENLEQWLLKGKIKLDKGSAQKLKALCVIVKEQACHPCPAYISGPITYFF